MECMINIINFLDKHNGSIMCLLTLVIVGLTYIQKNIANHQKYY